MHNEGSATLSSSTFSGNTADTGAGISNQGDLLAFGATIAANEASLSGGGIHQSSATALVDLRSTLLADNGGGFHPDIRDVAGGMIQARFSLIGDVGPECPNAACIVDLGNNLIGGGGNPVIDPRLGPLQDNGGLTKTHQLLVGSPAIDAGSGVFSDQRGFDRPVDIPAVNDPPPDNGADIGAFELQLYDYGDAPDTQFGSGNGNYQTLAADNGPSHRVTVLFSCKLCLGQEADGEVDAWPNSAAAWR